MSEQPARKRPDGQVTETEPKTTNEQAAHRRTPAAVRSYSLLGVALLAIGATAYLAVPAWSGTSAHSVAAAAAHPSASSTLPGPMPGAPTARPAPSATPTIGPHVYSHVTPTALLPSIPAFTRRWSSGSGGTALAAVTALADNTLLAQQTGQYAIMLPDCQELKKAARRALIAEPIPDIAMEARYLTALVSLKGAAVTCETAIQQVPDGVEDTVTHVDQTLMALVASELSRGESDLFAASEMLRKQ
jgi:hypothetical protein